MKPFVTFVRDYHDFSDIKRTFSHAGYDLDYLEIGCGFSDLTENCNYGQYHTVFFLKENIGEALEIKKSFGIW